VGVDFTGIFFAVGFLAAGAVAFLPVVCAVDFDAEGDVPTVSVADKLTANSSTQARIAARRIRLLLSNIA
jgi:hypothetical protein